MYSTPPPSPRHHRHKSQHSTTSATPATRHRRRRTTSTSSHASTTSQQPLMQDERTTPPRRTSTQYSPVSRRSSRAFSFGTPGPDPGSAVSPDGGGGGFFNGAGNLADELEKAFDEEDDDYTEEGEGLGLDLEQKREDDGRPRDSGIGVESPTSRGGGGKPVTHIREQSRGHSTRDVHASPSEQHQPSPTNNQATPGQQEEPEDDGLPASLNARIAEVSKLAAQGTASLSSSTDGAIDEELEPERDQVQTLLTALRGLSSDTQSALEGGATRLITAHAALATHLAHQTRALQGLSYGLLLPGTASPTRGSSNIAVTPPPEEEEGEDIAALLAALPPSLPRPARPALDALASLDALTADAASSLAGLSDALHMARQTTSTAARRLRGAKEAVRELRKEEEERAEGVKWIEQGDWSRKLECREGARVCGEVVQGFEDVCGLWRGWIEAGAAGRAPGVGVGVV